MKIWVVLGLILSLCVTLSVCDEGEENVVNDYTITGSVPDEHFVPIICYLIWGCLMLWWSSFKFGNMMEDYYKNLGTTHNELPALTPFFLLLVSMIGSISIANLHFFDPLTNTLIFILTNTFFNYNIIFLHSKENKFRSVVTYILLQLLAVLAFVYIDKELSDDRVKNVICAGLFIIVWCVTSGRQYVQLLCQQETVPEVDDAVKE